MVAPWRALPLQTLWRRNGPRGPAVGRSWKSRARDCPGRVAASSRAAALPSEVRGPLPQLVRDLGAALARQQTEHEALKKKLLQLQPAVINYDKKSTEQLTKAVLQATAGTSGAPDGGGALPRLLKDLAAQLAVQEDEQEKQKKALDLETTKKARTARRAAALKALLLKTSPKVEERAALLFDELADRTTLAIEDATKGYEQPEGKSSSWSTDEKKEEAARWQDSLSEVRGAPLVVLAQSLQHHAGTLVEALAAGQVVLERSDGRVAVTDDGVCIWLPRLEQRGSV